MYKKNTFIIDGYLLLIFQLKIIIFHEVIKKKKKKKIG